MKLNKYNKDENDLEDFEDFEDFYGIDLNDGDPEELNFNDQPFIKDKLSDIEIENTEI